MKIAIFSDLHIYKHQGYTKFEDVAQDFLIHLFNYCKEEEIDTVFFLGDFFHIKNKLHVSSFIKAIDVLRMMRDNNIKIHFLIGNHDAPQMGTTDHSIMYAFEEYGKVIPLYDWEEIDNVRFHFLSYTNELPAFQFAENKKNVLLGHLDINDFMMDNGFTCDEGFTSSNFKKFDTVFSGHFHKHQINGNIIYVGSPYQTRLSERRDDKGFIVLNTSDLSWKYEFYNDAPQFKEVDVNDIDIDSLVGNFVRIKTHKDNINLVDIKNKLLEAGVENVEFVYEDEDDENELTVVEDLNLGSMQDLASAYFDNIEKNNMFKKVYKEMLDQHVVDKKYFMEVFNEIEESLLTGWKPED